MLPLYYIFIFIFIPL